MRFVIIALLVIWGAPIAIEAMIENPPSLISTVVFVIIVIANERLRPKSVEPVD